MSKITMHSVKAAFISDKSRREIVAIRNGFTEYISTHKCNEEEFVQCICQILNDDDYNRHLKADLVRILQEQSVLIINAQSFDEIISTLNSLFQRTKNTSENIIRSQVLTTITSILLTCDFLIKKDSFDSWFVSQFHLLWKLLQGSNDGSNLILREIACECLIEIEETYPCLLLHKLEDLVTIGFKEKLYPFQNYANLVSLLIKNVALFRSKSLDRTNEILVLLAQSQLRNDVSSIFESFNVNKVIVQLMDLTCLFSTFSSSFVTANVIEVVCALQRNPSIFKTFIHRNIHTHDLTIIRTILDLRNTFGSRLFAKNEEVSLIEQTVSKSSHPHYTSTRQCILFSWTLQYLQTLDVTYDAEFFWPLPWDSPDVEERKLCILALILSHKSEVDQRALVGYLDSLVLRLEYDNDGHRIAILCRLLFHCYARYDYVEFEKHVTRILLDVVRNHPRFINHVLELLSKIKHLQRQNCLFASVMSLVMNFITDLTEDVATDCLAHYLTFLVKCAEEESTIARPRKIVRFITRMLDSRTLEDDKSKSWQIGHCVLEVCKRLLCRHNSNLYFSDLGEILQKMFTSHGELDVRDRAEFYYMLLISLSPQKITSMLNFKPQNQNGNYNFTHLVGGDATYSYPSPIVAISEQILILKRVVDDTVDVEDKSDILTDDIDLEFYFEWLSHTLIQWRTEFKYELWIASNVGQEYDDLYAVVLSFHGTKLNNEVQSLNVLHLAKDEGSVILSVDLVLGSSIPTKLSTCAVFNTKDGRTCSVNLNPLSVDFKDLFQPLPVPSDFVACSKEYRNKLADKLWEKFTNDCDTKGYHQSVIRILVKREEYVNMLITALKKFVTQSLNCEDSKMECTFGIFLPQRCHLILRANYVEENEEPSVVVFLATDNSDVLPLINIYLRSFEKMV